MTSYPPQPTLPIEGPFTDPELNFIDESPHGFFPENQDSNWGYRRKVYSDEIKLIFDQLALIYGEAFPSTSQDFLDEWEKTAGLPQNPTNKTLAQRRVMVLNRLRGGPFTRKQRREIVESYITATFGDPILLLPAGVPMIVAGQPLYNEAGDLSTLYQIIEAVTLFTYTVRIQSGLAIDQNGLERDLHHFTPAGINIIFDYAWSYKVASDVGSGLDLVNASTGSAFKIQVFDVGAGREAIGQFGVQTGVGVDSAFTIHVGSDANGATTETASFTASFTAPSDGGLGVDVTSRRTNMPDSGSGTDSGDALGGPKITSFTPNNGPVNTIVTITGRGFTGATSVKFAGINAAAFSVDSDTQVRAFSSATGQILITTPKGTYTSAASFTMH